MLYPLLPPDVWVIDSAASPPKAGAEPPSSSLCSSSLSSINKSFRFLALMMSCWGLWDEENEEAGFLSTLVKWIAIQAEPVACINHLLSERA